MTYILGGWQSDFARNWAREGVEIADGFAEALREGLADALMEPEEIDVGHVGNFVGDLFAGQGLLGGFFAMAEPKQFTFTPAAWSLPHAASKSASGMSWMFTPPIPRDSMAPQPSSFVARIWSSIPSAASSANPVI